MLRLSWAVTIQTPGLNDEQCQTLNLEFFPNMDIFHSHVVEDNGYMTLNILSQPIYHLLIFKSQEANSHVLLILRLLKDSEWTPLEVINASQALHGHDLVQFFGSWSCTPGISSFSCIFQIISSKMLRNMTSLNIISLLNSNNCFNIWFLEVCLTKKMEKYLIYTIVTKCLLNHAASWAIVQFSMSVANKLEVMELDWTLLQKALTF